jgi:hypothetical protein
MRYPVYHANDSDLRSQISSHLQDLSDRVGGPENPEGPPVYTGINVRWMGDWIQQQYYQGDQVFDEGWLTIANKDTQDRAAPQPTGVPQWLLPTNPAWTSQFYTGVVYSGIEILIPDGQISSVLELRVWVPDVSANAHYRVIVYDVNTGQTTAGPPFLGTVLLNPGWYPVLIQGSFLRGGENVGIVVESYNSAATTDFNFPWVYTGTSQTNADPGSGNWNRDNQHTVIRLNNTDADAGDQSANLALVTPGTIIRAQVEGDPTNYWEYSVVTATNEVGWYSYSVTLVNSSGVGPAPLDRCDMQFQVPVHASTEYVQIVDEYLNDPIISGFIAFDDIGTLIVNDNAYGIDVQYQNYIASDDWDIQAYSGGIGSGSSSAQQLSSRSRITRNVWFDRWLPAELDRLADGNEGSVWPPGPPPTAVQILRINQFVAYTSSKVINLGDSQLWQELEWLESVGILDPGRAAILIQPP